MFLLDTNVLSELRRPSRHGSVVQWLSDQPTSAIFVPSIAFLELQRGAELTRFQHAARADELDLWIDALVLSSNIVDFGSEAARQYSRFTRRRPDFVSEDAMIAAIARVHGYTVATRNIKDFQAFDVSLINPFEYER